MRVHVQQKLLVQDDQVIYRVTLLNQIQIKNRIYFLKTQTSLIKVHHLGDEVCGLYYVDSPDGIFDPLQLQVNKLVFADWYKVGEISMG
jgi:hypothetical protein